MNNKILELAKEQESYRYDLMDLMDADMSDNKILHDISEILINVNLISIKIQDMGVNNDLHSLYSKLAYNIKKEKYLKCKDIYEKIINYND